MRIRLHSAVLLAAAAVLVGLGVGVSLPAIASGPTTLPAHHHHHGGGNGNGDGNGNGNGHGHGHGNHGYGHGHGNHGYGHAPFRHMDHVFVIMMENRSYSALLNPANADTTFIQSLAAHYGLETDYYGVTHTSMPNYIAATSGSTWGSNADDELQADQGYFNHLNLVDQLEEAGVSWKGYMESMPSVGYGSDYGDCTAGTSSVPNDPDCSGTTAAGKPDTGTALYVRKHNPFMQYPDVFDNPARTDNIVPLTELSTDLADGNVPAFSWISPNICDDMHGGAPECPYPSTDSLTDPNMEALFQDGDGFLHTWVNAITSSPAWTGNSAIFVMWDEASYENTSPYGPTDLSGCCDSPVLPSSPVDPTSANGGDLVGGTLYGGGHVPMIVIARRGARGMTDSTPTNHYSLLQTIELNWGLPFLGNASDTVQVQSLAPLLQGSGSGNGSGGNGSGGNGSGGNDSGGNGQQ